MRHPLPQVRRLLALWMLVLSVSACALIPKDFNEGMAAAGLAADTAVQGLDQLVLDQKISKKNAQAALAMIDNVRAFLGVAQGANAAGDLTLAQSNLALARNSLTALQAFIDARKKP